MEKVDNELTYGYTPSNPNSIFFLFYVIISLKMKKSPSISYITKALYTPSSMQLKFFDKYTLLPLQDACMKLPQ